MRKDFFMICSSRSFACLAWLSGLGVVLGFGPVGAKQAQATYVIVDFASGPTYSSFTPPFFLDKSFSLANLGSGEGLADLPNGVMRGQMASSGGAHASGTYQVNGESNDFLHFSGLPTGGAPVTFHLIADGTATFPADVASGQVSFIINLGGGGIGQPSVGETYTTRPGDSGTQIPPIIPVPIHLEAFITRMETNITAQNITTDFALSGFNGASFDFFSSSSMVRLQIDLPQGASVTSDGGLSRTSVPEPSSLVLSLMGASALLVYRKRLVGLVARRSGLASGDQQHG